MRNRLVITLCAVVSLLAGAGLLTFWLVRSLAPAAALNYTPWPLSPEPYTQADLDEALALRTEGYEAQSVAAFDRALADWTNEAAFHAREERIRRLLCSYEEDGPEAEFVLGTLAAAMGEEAVTIEDVIEPFLIQLGFLGRTPRGRVATAKAYAHLGLPDPRQAPPADDGQQRLV